MNKPTPQLNGSDYRARAMFELKKRLHDRNTAEELRLDATEIQEPILRWRATQRKVMVCLVDQRGTKELARIPYHLPWPAIISDLLDEFHAWQDGSAQGAA